MGSEALVVGASVSNRADIDRLFKTVTEKWGRVDVLVNNAGKACMRNDYDSCEESELAQ
jgi:NADP-dependent 3-hydroxy acid dehydrogenase YdfG